MIPWELILAGAWMLMIFVLMPVGFFFNFTAGQNHSKPERRGRRWKEQTALAVLSVLLCLVVLVGAYSNTSSSLTPYDNWLVSLFAFYLASDMAMDALLSYRVVHDKPVHTPTCYAAVIFSAGSAVALLGTFLYKAGDVALSYFAWT